MEIQNTRLIERWLAMKLAESDRKFLSSKDAWNSKVSMRGMANGSHHIIELAKIVSDTIRETSHVVFDEINSVSTEPDRFDLAKEALQNQMQKWNAVAQRSVRNLQNIAMLSHAIDPLMSQASSDIVTLSDLAQNAPNLSTIPQNDYLGLWLEDQKILSLREIEGDLKALYAQLSAAGTLRTGYRIKKAIALWEGQTKNFSDLAFAKGKELGSNKENHIKIALKIRSILSEFELALPDIVFFPKGAVHSRDDSSMRTAQKLLDTIKSDVERKITLAAMDFEQIRAPSVEHIETENNGAPAAKPAQIRVEELPRLSELALQSWWNALASKTQALPQNELLAMAKASFADKFISRDRIRELTGARKRGRKPFCGKVPAK